MFYREELLDKLTKSIISIRNDKKKKEVIRNHFAVEYNILPGDTTQIFNKPEEFLEELDNRELALLTKQLIFTTSVDIELNHYFTDQELKEAKSYDARVFIDSFELPLIIENVIPFSYMKAYIGMIDIQIIKKLFESQILFYDYEIQRELTVIKKKNGQFRQKPTLYMNNVNEICNDLLKGKLEPTTLIWNAKARTSEDIRGELYYDPKNLTLTITKGTKLAIMDGYHRINGALKALRINPDLKFQFPVQFTELSTREAQEFQSQIAKATPISKNRKIQLQQERYSDTIVNRLNLESDLKDRISLANSISNLDEMLISYGKLSKLIDRHFDIRSNRDATAIGDYLIDFFNELIGVYVDDFIINMPRSREFTLVNNARMFPGYVLLASKMYNNQIDVNELEGILSQLDFRRKEANWFWVSKKVIDEDGHLITHKNSDRVVEHIFDELKLPIKEVK